jgi:glycyl-tRNA synthetase beta chain
MTAADFLVELGTEELPPKALRPLELAFAEAVSARSRTVRSSRSPRHGGWRCWCVACA